MKVLGVLNLGYYNGVFIGSTYELVYYIYQIDHNIDIKRNTRVFNYEHEGKQHTYLPDFIIDNVYIEIKGYHTPLVDIKTKAVIDAGEKIKVLYLEDLEPMMNYIDEKFGIKHNGKSNVYHTLYDEYKPTYTYICSTCGKEFQRDKLITTNEKFCSASCAGKYSRPANKDYVDIDYVKSIAKEIPGLPNYWYSKNNELFGLKYGDRMLRYKMQIGGYYKIKGQRYSISKLNELCYNYTVN